MPCPEEVAEAPAPKAPLCMLPKEALVTCRVRRELSSEHESWTPACHRGTSAAKVSARCPEATPTAGLTPCGFGLEASPHSSPNGDFGVGDGSCTPWSPSSGRSTDSTLEFHLPQQSLILLDWDDTLLPTTECVHVRGLDLEGELCGDIAEALSQHAKAASALLQEARDLADRVVVVTNSGKGWVEASCRAWMPTLLPQLSQCKVVSARSSWEPFGVISPAGWKAHAFNEEISSFYARYKHQSWKNIVSIGDTIYEHEALGRVVRIAPPCNARGRSCCRSKCVKLLEQPSVNQLTQEAKLLCESLRGIVSHDGDLHLQLPSDLKEPLDFLRKQLGHCAWHWAPYAH